MKKKNILRELVQAVESGMIKLEDIKHAALRASVKNVLKL